MGRYGAPPLARARHPNVSLNGSSFGASLQLLFGASLRDRALGFAPSLRLGPSGSRSLAQVSGYGAPPLARARHPNVSLKGPSFGASLRLLPPPSPGGIGCMRTRLSKEKEERERGREVAASRIHRT